MSVKLEKVKCPECGKLQCEASGVVKKKCPRCRTMFIYDTKKKLYTICRS